MCGGFYEATKIHIKEHQICVLLVNEHGSGGVEMINHGIFQRENKLRVLRTAMYFTLPACLQ